MKPQLSLFDNSTCTQCGKDIPEGHVYCQECAEAWADKYLSPDNLKSK